MIKIKIDRNRMAAVAVAAALTAFVLTGCFAAMGNYMNWQRVDMARALASDAGSQKWNTYRFLTEGPFPEQRIAYVLFGDDVTVDMWHTPFVNLGKMSLREVMDNHDATLKEHMWIGTPMTIQEYQRGGKVIAYTANEFQMEVDLWEIATAGSKLNIRVIYADRRSFSGSNGFPEPSSH
ncbi:hypothetical protein EG829_15520 [bacterium]|nr:hypothetical protein [bacterium]